MDEYAAAGIDLAGTYAYGPESYDSVYHPLAARSPATTAAPTPPRSSTSPRTASSAAPTPTAWPGPGRHRHRLRGRLGPHRHSGNGEPMIGSYAVQLYGDDNRIDAEPGVPDRRGRPEFQTMPNDPVTSSGPVTAC